MALLPQVDWLYALSGLLVGGLVGLTGVGGGSLMTPLLMLAFGVAPLTAVGTDLLYAAVTKCGGAVVHACGGTIDWRVVRRLALGSLPATGATLFYLAHAGVGSSAHHGLVSSVLGIALVLTAGSLLFRRLLLERLAPGMERLGERGQAVLTVALGLLVGTLVSLTSVGAGAIGGTVLLLLYPRAPLVRIVGADIAHAVPLTLLAGLGHWALGTVDLAVLGSLLVGSLPGIAVASRLARRAPDRILRPILAVTLAIVGLRLAI